MQTWLREARGISGLSGVKQRKNLLPHQYVGDAHRTASEGLRVFVHSGEQVMTGRAGPVGPESEDHLALQPDRRPAQQFPLYRP